MKRPSQSPDLSSTQSMSEACRTFQIAWINKAILFPQCSAPDPPPEPVLFYAPNHNRAVRHLLTLGLASSFTFSMSLRDTMSW